MIEMPDRVADTFRKWCVDVEPGDMHEDVYDLGDFHISLHFLSREFSVGLYFVPEERRFADFLVASRTLRLWFDERLMGALDFSAWKKLLSRHHPLCDLFMDSKNIAGWRFAHVRKRDGDEIWYGRKGIGHNLQYIDVPEYAPNTHWRERYAPERLTFNQMRGCL